MGYGDGDVFITAAPNQVVNGWGGALLSTRVSCAPSADAWLAGGQCRLTELGAVKDSALWFRRALRVERERRINASQVA